MSRDNVRYQQWKQTP